MVRTDSEKMDEALIELGLGEEWTPLLREAHRLGISLGAKINIASMVLCEGHPLRVIVNIDLPGDQSDRDLLETEGPSDAIH